MLAGLGFGTFEPVKKFQLPKAVQQKTASDTPMQSVNANNMGII